MKSAIKLVLSAGVVAALSWAAALAVQTPAGAATPASSATSNYGSFNSVSCASAGNCAAAGVFGPDNEYQAIVNNETNGKWGRDKQIAGLSSLPGGTLFSSQLVAVSCPTVGNCGAGGWYTTNDNFEGSLVVDEKGGVWGSVQPIDTSHLKGGPAVYAQIAYLSCPAPGDCTAAGSYVSKTTSSVFVVSEQDGTWGPAEDLPGKITVDNYATVSGIFTLSCSTPGNCVVGGSHRGSRDNAVHAAWVATETNGVWGIVQDVPGIKVVSDAQAATNSVSCTAGGNCTAVGYYQTHLPGLYNYPDHPFITSRVHGRWGPIQTVPGLETLPTGGTAPAILDLAWCRSAGYCVAVGHYPGPTASARWFSVTERNGTWGKAVNLRTGARTHIYITTMSCTSLANCSAGGYYYLSPTNIWEGAFVIGKANGAWGKAEQIPGLNRLNHGGYAHTNSVSCYAPGSCVAAGDAAPRQRLFDYPIIATEIAGTWGNATEPRLP